jgi:hypothetical protein
MKTAIPQDETGDYPGECFSGSHPWDCNAGDIGHSVNFDFDAIDGHGVKSEDWDSIKEASDGLQKLLLWIWESRDFKNSFIRFVAMSAAMRPGLLDDRSYAQIAKKIKCTKSFISYDVKLFERKFGLHFRRSRRAESSEAFRAARFKNNHGPNSKNKNRFLK